MATEVYLGYPPQHVIDWIKAHSQPSELGTPLYFEGQEAGATVAMLAWNNITSEPEQHLHCNLECSTDGMSTWSAYDGVVIQLDNCAGKRVYFKAPEGQPNTNGFRDQENDIFHSFELKKTVKAGGNIQFLLESTGTRMTLAVGCYSGMFYDCTSLTQAPVLPATTLADECYQGMFSGCTSLTQAPVLPATTLADRCYLGMFSGCTSLTQAPVLPATTLADECYQGMFYNCTFLTSIDVSFTAWNPANATNSWMNNAGTQATGTKTFTCPAALPNTTGDSNIPSGWTRVEK